MNPKSLKKSLTLIELLLASAFLIVVVAGSTALFNFAMREAVLLTRRSIALEDPAVFTLQHIQRNVFPSQGIDLVGTITNNTSTAIDVISDGSVSPSRGVRYALDDASHEIRFSPDKNAPAVFQVLARNISQLSFQNAETPTEHTNFRLLGLRITGQDYERAEIKNFTLQTRVLARRWSGVPLRWLVYNLTFTHDAAANPTGENKLYSDLPLAITEARDGDQLWLSGFNWETGTNQEVFTNGFSYSKLLYIQGGYRFAFQNNEYWDKTRFEEANTVRNIAVFQTVLRAGITFQGLRNIAMGDPDFSFPETPLGSGGFGQIDGIFFESGLILREESGNTHINFFPLISNSTFRNFPAGTALNIRLASIPAWFRWNTLIRNCLFENTGVAIWTLLANNQCSLTIEDSIFRNVSQIGQIRMPFTVRGDNNPATFEFENIGGTIFLGNALNFPMTITDANFNNIGRIRVSNGTFTNCTFRNITGNQWGIYSSGGLVSRFDQCSFSGDMILRSRFIFNACDFSEGRIGIREGGNFSFCRFFNNNPIALLLPAGSELNYCSFYNNTANGNTPPPGISPGSTGVVIPSGNITINHCVFFNNTSLYSINPAQQSIVDPCDPWANTTTINDTIFFNNGPNDIRTNGTDIVNLSYSVYQNIFQSGGAFNEVPLPTINPIVNNPFVNAANGNFHLAAGSPAIDARPTPDPAHDDRDTNPANGISDCDPTNPLNTLRGDMGIFGGPGAICP